MQICRSNPAPYPVYSITISSENVPREQRYRPRVPAVIAEAIMKGLEPGTPPGALKNQIVQTLFRESEAQTIPFTPEPLEPVDGSLEILTLGWLSYRNGLPAGMREALIIERARQRRAWERALPAPFSKLTKQMQIMILEAIEVNEWAFREIEMVAMSSIRMELAEKCANEKLASNRVMYERRLERYIAAKKEETASTVEKLRVKLRRSQRKLMFERNKVNRRYHRWDPTRELGDKTSEFYAPLARFGVDPRRGHEIIPKRFRFWNVFSHLEVLNLPTRNAFKGGNVSFDYESKSKPKNQSKQLCIRHTRWTVNYLESLYNQLKSLRTHGARRRRPCHLKQRIAKASGDLTIPSVEGKSDEEEALYQASLFLQKTIKGRAVQTVMFEGRVKCQELLDELKITRVLENCLRDKGSRSRGSIYALQRAAEIQALKEKRKAEILHSLEGKTVADILDFLSKELLRLQNERITHEYAMMADRERHKREAEEAGRRQNEEERRREHDEMFKQISRTYQNSVDLITQDFYMYVMKNFSSEKSREDAEKYARMIDQAANEAHLRGSVLEEEEIVGDLVHNFCLTEVQKTLVRDRLKARQKMMLTICHDEIYSCIENLVEGTRSPSGLLLPLQRPRKHKIPRLIPVKFIKLKLAGSLDTVNEKTWSATQTIRSMITSHKVEEHSEKDVGLDNSDEDL